MPCDSQQERYRNCLISTQSNKRHVLYEMQQAFFHFRNSSQATPPSLFSVLSSPQLIYSPLFLALLYPELPCWWTYDCIWPIFGDQRVISNDWPKGRSFYLPLAFYDYLRLQLLTVLFIITAPTGDSLLSHLSWCSSNLISSTCLFSLYLVPGYLTICSLFLQHSLPLPKLILSLKFLHLNHWDKFCFLPQPWQGR